MITVGVKLLTNSSFLSDEAEISNILSQQCWTICPQPTSQTKPPPNLDCFDC